jgi:hypothetical protein
MNKFIALFLVCMVAAATYILFPSDERAIRSNLDDLADYCSTTGNDKAIAALTKISLAGKLFQDPCQVEVKSFDISRELGRKEVTDHILMMKKMMPATRFTFSDTDILFPGDKRAELSTTLRLTGKARDNRFTDAYELSILLSKVEGDWLFSSVTVVEFIEQ